MKALISLVLLLTISNGVDIDKQVIPYSIVTAKSDLIVEGEIKNVYDETYEFTITDFIKGKTGDTISVNKWKEWMCDSRQIKHLKGQNLILFLQKDQHGEYKIINGSTGELIINSDGSILRYDYERLPNKSVVKKGIKMLLNSIRYNGELYSNGEFEFLVSKTEFEKMKKMNLFYFKSTRGITY
ncbi:hypothetical protein [uncultured Tenacibaculum sp.]|uniref:hypothetical protein n=1 Tax=uncultured Tenacibaculum sp. TaxID=174713 RepID=UPI002615B051|nr:hypothetical protein [uncultured Tenacibaculum sp.]